MTKTGVVVTRWDASDEVHPEKVCRELPPTFGPMYGEWWLVMQMIHSGKYESRQVDWGAWSVRVTRQQLLDCLDRWYAGIHEDPADVGSLFKQVLDKRRQDFAALRQCVEDLPVDQDYALVAWEL